MRFHVYILQSQASARYYCGQTSNLSDRLQRHSDGRSKATKAGRPWSLVWTKDVLSRAEAVRLESKIKKRGIKRYLGSAEKQFFFDI